MGDLLSLADVSHGDKFNDPVAKADCNSMTGTDPFHEGHKAWCSTVCLVIKLLFELDEFWFGAEDCNCSFAYLHTSNSKRFKAKVFLAKGPCDAKTRG